MSELLSATISGGGSTPSARSSGDQREQRLGDLERVAPRSAGREARLQRLPRAGMLPRWCSANPRTRFSSGASFVFDDGPGSSVASANSSAASGSPMKTRHSAILASTSRTSCSRSDVQIVRPRLLEAGERHVEAAGAQRHPTELAETLAQEVTVLQRSPKRQQFEQRASASASSPRSPRISAIFICATSASTVLPIFSHSLRARS